MSKKINNLYGYIVTVITFIITGYLFISALFRRAELSLDLTNEKTSFKSTYPILTVLVIAVFLFFMSLFEKKIKEKDSSKMIKKLLLGEFIFCTFFTVLVNAVPGSDQRWILMAAEAFARGDYSHLASGQYMSRFPYQLPLAMFWEPFFHLFGNMTDFVLQYLQSFIICGIQYLIYDVYRKLSDPDKGINEQFIIIVLILDIPLLMYTTFLYGPIISLFFILLGIRLLVHYDKGVGTILSIIAGSFLVSYGCILKVNSIISSIAIIITIIFISLKRHRALLWFIPMFLIFFITGYVGIHKFYEIRSGIVTDNGVPASFNIDIGLRENNIRADGWYLEDNLDTYFELGDDPKAADEIYKENIQKSLDKFAASPSYTIAFFREKIDSSWLNPDFQALWNNEHHGHYIFEPSIVTSIFYGKMHDATQIFLNIIAVFVYGGAFILQIKNMKGLIKEKDFSVESNLYTLIFLGGFFFHLVWETKAQYMITYYCLLFPCAMTGWISLLSMIKNRRR